MNADLSEKAVLGLMMLDKECVRIGLTLLTQEHFNQSIAIKVFDAIKTLRAIDRAVDIISVSEKLAEDGKPLIGHVGLAEWTMLATSTAFVEEYARSVRRAWFDRQIEKQILKIQMNQQQDRVSNVEKLRKLCVERESEDRAKVFSLSKNLHDSIELLEKTTIKSYDVGFPTLNRCLGGIQPGDLMTVAARTSFGKTALMTKMALNLAKAGIKVLYFCGEMAEIQIVQRILPIVTRIPALNFRTKQVNWAKVMEGASKISEYPLSISGIPSPSLSEIESITFATRADVVVVDYLQRCTLPKGENRRIQTQDFMVALKNFCRIRNVAGILGCQINRQVDRNEDARPVLADLRESAAIEEESDQVILMWASQSEMYGDNPTLTVEAFLAKNRHGRRGKINLLFERNFVNMVEQEDRPVPRDFKVEAAGETNA